MDKVIRDGMVAVLYSPGFGGGWSTWGAKEQHLYLPAIVKWVEDGKKEHIDVLVGREFPDFPGYLGGANQLKIEWMPEGTRFRVTEYDGSEDIEYIDQIDYYVA